MANHLKNETSPYLQQHKNNPVDWWPWCDEAFEKAKKEHKAIFISIGYSSCHWCHVMEEEIFEDKECAEVLNKHFISIKVDREERPDIDKYYQEVHMLLNQRPGGWPTSIFATPENKPFFAATYIPKYPKPGMNSLGFLDLIKIIAQKIEENDPKLFSNADEIESYMKNINHPKEATKLTLDIYKNFLHQLKGNFDSRYGGFTPAPKFPMVSTLLSAIDMYRLNQDKNIKDMLTFTLDNMIKGGLYDLVDGGFCRYSVDEKWLVPHFEKMLYDNAGLIKVYLRAYETFKDERYLDIAKESAEFLEEFMKEDGLYYSASDADSEGEEGKYFVYTYDELKKAGLDDATLEAIGVDFIGNFEDGKSIVRIKKDLPKNWESTRKALKEIRKKRVYPFIDKKIQTSWNAMLIDSYFELGAEDETYTQKAKESLEKLLNLLYVNDKLYHTTIIGHKPKIEAFLEDYAFLAKALIGAYEKTFDETYLIKAQIFINKALELFYKNGVWYFSVGDFQTKADTTDSTYTSAVSIMIDNLLSISTLLEDDKYRVFAFKTLEYNSYELSRKPIYYPYMFDMMTRYLKEDIIIKSKQQNLLKNIKELSFMNYPYTLLKEENKDGYMICGIKSCFANVKDIQSVKKEVEKITNG